MTKSSLKTLSDPPAIWLAVEHPELDEPEGDVSWERWLEGWQRLEMALLLAS